MTTATLLTLLATVLSAEGMILEVDLGREAGIRPGDRGLVYYELGEGSEIWAFEVGEGTVLEVSRLTASLTVDPETRVLPGYLVRFEIPAERLAPVTELESPRRAPPRAPAQGSFVVRESLRPCLNLRPLPAADAPPLDCLRPGRSVAVIDRMAGWKKVRLDDGREGWVAERFLRADMARRVRKLAALPDPLEPPPSFVADRDPLSSQETARQGIDAGADFRRRLERARSALESSRAARRDLEGRLDAASRERDELRRTASELGASQQSLAADLVALRAELAETHATSEDPPEEQGERGFEAATHPTAVEAELARSRAALSEAERARRGLEQRLEQATLDRGALGQKVADLETERQALRSELEAARATRGALEAELERTRAATEELAARLADQEAELRVALEAGEAVARVADVGTETAALRAELQASRDELDRHRTTELELRDRLDRSENERLAAESRYEDRLRQAETGASEIRDRLAQSAASVLDLEGRLELSSRALAASEKVRGELVAKLEEVRAQGDALRGEIESSSRAERRELAEALEKARTEAEELRQRLEVVLRLPAEAGFSVLESLPRCLRLRPQPSLEAAAVDCLPPGTVVGVIDAAPDWKRVRLEDGREGWVAERYLDSGERRRLEAAEATLQAELAETRLERDELRRQIAAAEAKRQALGEALERLRQSSPVSFEPAPAAIPTPAPPPEAAVRALVEAWARAWSEQNADDYLGFYSEAFQPPSGQSYGDWEAQRRALLAKPSFIRVEVSGCEVELLDPERARVRFIQEYRSDVDGDTVAKRLELVREGGGWRILEESVER